MAFGFNSKVIESNLLSKNLGFWLPGLPIEGKKMEWRQIDPPAAILKTEHCCIASGDVVSLCSQEQIESKKVLISQFQNVTKIHRTIII